MKTSKSIEIDAEGASPHAVAGTRWYAVHSQPNREFRAKYQLENQEFEVFTAETTEDSSPRAKTYQCRRSVFSPLSIHSA